MIFGLKKYFALLKFRKYFIQVCKILLYVCPDLDPKAHQQTQANDHQGAQVPQGSS